MKYFAYGMNTNLEEMRRRCPTAVCIGSAQVKDYKFVFRTHADIEQSPGDICYGVLWEVSNADLKALDALEGFPYYYNRFRVKVDLDDYFVFALTYQMNDQSFYKEPSAGYLAMVTEGYKQNGTPADQIAKAINTVPCYMSTATNQESINTW